MKPHTLLTLAAVAGGAFLLGSLATSAPAPDSPALALTDLLQQGMPGPRPEHKPLQKFVGEWEVGIGMQMAGAPEPMRFSGHISGRMGCNGTWLITELEGSMMGVTYEGLALQGYNPARKTYVGAWFDMSKGDFDVMEGTFNADQTVLTNFGEMPNPFQAGQVTRVKSIFRFLDEDHITYEEFLPEGGDGWKLWLTMDCRRAPDGQDDEGEHGG